MLTAAGGLGLYPTNDAGLMPATEPTTCGGRPSRGLMRGRLSNESTPRTKSSQHQAQVPARTKCATPSTSALARPAGLPHLPVSATDKLVAQRTRRGACLACSFRGEACSRVGQSKGNTACAYLWQFALRTARANCRQHHTQLPGASSGCHDASRCKAATLLIVRRIARLASARLSRQADWTEACVGTHSRCRSRTASSIRLANSAQHHPGLPLLPGTWCCGRQTDHSTASSPALLRALLSTSCSVFHVTCCPPIPTTTSPRCSPLSSAGLPGWSCLITTLSALAA